MTKKSYILLTFTILAILPSNEATLSPDDEDFFGVEADRYDWSKHPCRRNCGIQEKPKICRYVFVVEQYSTMSKACYDCPFNVTDCYRPHCLPADGTQKTVYTVNRQLPGPTIEVCHNDLIVVEVRNLMLSESTTIHWHGIKQELTPYMDGVPSVTQCPILPGEKFRYVFKATTSGTYFWHSHIGMQRSDGLFGALVIHPTPNQNVHRNLYEYDDQHMIIGDWMRASGQDGLVRLIHDSPNVVPETILINGLGPFRRFERGNEMKFVPYAVFKVIKGKRTRFRLTDAGSEDCAIEMSIDNHTLLVISMDSKDIEPVEVDVIAIWPGERVDFIVKANKKIDNYWIRFRGYGNCEPFGNSTGVFQAAILRYQGSKIENPKGPIAYDIPQNTNTTRILNPYNLGLENLPGVNIHVPLLNATDPNDEALSESVDKQIYMTFDLYPLDNYDYHRKNLYGFNQTEPARRTFSLQLNHITLKMPSFPLLSQWKMIGPKTLCDPSTLNMEYCRKEYCACTQVLKVKLHSVVEIIFVDEGNIGVINHPLHLHGHFFRIIATENLEGPVTIERVKKLDREGKIKRRLDRAPIKDTMKAPGGGYTIVRFYANNPGYWFFHCHFDQHMNFGMALIFKVGEHKDFPPVPPNFPKCGGYLPYPSLSNINNNQMP